MMNIKTSFRYIYATIIFIITIMLVWTCIVKTQDYFQAQHVQAKPFSLSSNEKTEYRLLSDNQKTKKLLYVIIPNQGFIAKINCEHYLTTLCTDQDNQTQFRKINQVDLLAFKQHVYIQNINYTHTQNTQRKSFNFTSEEIQSFYQADIETLKYQLFTLVLFSFFALYVCFRILRNFRSFLQK